MAGINFDFTGGVLPGGITFTRPSIGTYNSSGNILTTASNNVARFNYIAGVANLLIEGSATNLLLQSNAFSNASWLNNGIVATAAQFVSPDGLNNGWALASTPVNGYVFQQPTVSAVPYVISVWIKQITGSTDAQTSISGAFSGGLTISATLTRKLYTVTPAAGANATVIQVITNAGTIGAYGAQLETGSAPTSYIPTTTSQVTRAADSAAFTIPTGVTALQFTFDDGSKQVVSVTPGPYTIPTNLNRPNIKSIQSAFVLDFTTGSLPGGVTLTRPSIGTYTSNAGLLATAGNDVARFNYVSGVSCLLIEGSATNLLLQSNTFSDVAWVPNTSVVVTAAQFISPDGSNNGWSQTSGTGFGSIQQTVALSNIAYTISAWTKRIVGAGPTIFFISNVNSGDIVTSATIARISSTRTPAAASGGVGVGNDAGAGNTNGLYGIQLETGSAPTSYIPTTTTTVTRSADAATFTVPSGINLLTYTFDDNSTQAVPVSPGPYTVPVTLARPNIKSIVGTTVPPPNFDFTTGVLPAGITFTRGSIGTYVNAAGTLITATNDAARFNYVAGVANLLIEPAATNLLIQSNAFTTAPWTTYNGGNATAAQFISPDGANNGWSFDAGTGFGGRAQTVTVSAIPYVISAWLKQITGTAPGQFYINTISSIGITLGTTIARYSYTGTPAAGSGLSAVLAAAAAAGNVGGCYGAQLETGSIPTSYIPTTTTAVTRAADSATFTIPTGINQLVYTFDDNSTQTVAVSPGSYTIPTTLNRPNIKSVVGRYAFDFTGGSLPAGMTFTRPSIGTYVNNAGTLITASNDVARFNYVAGVANLLIEGSATNLFVQSNNFSTTWGKSGTPVIASNQFASPDGANNGWSLDNGTSAADSIYQPITYSNIPHTMSVWSKQITAGTGTQLIIRGTPSGFLPTTVTVTRKSFTSTPPAGSNFANLQSAGPASASIGVYGAQLEAGSAPTSYIPTTTAAVTRAADAAVLTIPAGVNALLYTFDDGSTQQVSVTAGSYTIPVNLNRPNIKSIQGLGGFDFTSGTLPPGITFTRASIGTYFDGGNILRTASSNVARMNYVSGVSCLLIEGSATNLLPQSNNFLAAAWSAYQSCTITGSQFVSPDGTSNGFVVTTGPVTVSGCYQAFAVSNTTYTMSVWAKRITGSANDFHFYLNTITVSPTVPISATIARVFASITPAAGSELALFFFGNSATGNTNGIFGAQLETGSAPSSYIPTTTTSVTRAVDQATFTIPTGVTQLTYTFDDNSTQTVSATPGSYTIPVNLSRPNIKSIAWVTTAPITPTPSPARVGAFQSFGLAANIPLQLTAGGTYRLYILNTGPGNLFVSTGNTPGPNATVMVIPPLKAAPMTTTAGAIWLSSDQDSTVSIAAMPR